MMILNGNKLNLFLLLHPNLIPYFEFSQISLSNNSILFEKYKSNYEYTSYDKLI